MKSFQAFRFDRRFSLIENRIQVMSFGAPWLEFFCQALEPS